jgi:hypothetical protein
MVPAATLAEPLQEFHLFDKLPEKLQTLIWNFSLVPRVIRWGTTRAPPVILHVCRSSRKLAKKQYFFAYWVLDIRNRSTYVHLSLDIIYYKHKPFSSPIPWYDNPFPPRWIRNLEHLALPLISTGRTNSMANFAAGWKVHPLLWDEIISCCPKLKQVVLFMEPCLAAVTPVEEWLNLVDWDEFSHHEEVMVVSLMEALEEKQKKNVCQGLQLSFVRGKKQRL